MTMLRTPLYDWHVRHGARMVPFGGWDMPVQYSGIVAEHQAVRTHAGVFDISHMARITITGADALPFVESICTNRVGNLRVGQVRYSLICNDAGGILDDILVYRWPDHLRLVVNASNREKIIDWMMSHSAGHDAVIHDETMSSGMLAIQGPEAIRRVQPMFSKDISQLKYYGCEPMTWQGIACLVSRTGYTGEDGIEVILASGHLEPLADTLLLAGMLPCGLGARDTLRLEAGMPLYGHEMNEAIDPFSAKLGWAVKLDKGEFHGRDALLAKQAMPFSVERVGLLLEGKRAAREGCPVRLGDTLLGQVTSGSFSPTLQRPIAMALVTPVAVGAMVDVDIRGQVVPAQVVPLPFYQR